MDAIIVIAKPSGPTSFAIVERVKRLTRERKVGHGGTLDPLASGVLPVFLGQATRLVEYLHEYPKTYRAVIELGVTTDTYDAEGQVTGKTDITRYFQNTVSPHATAAGSPNPGEQRNPNPNRSTQPGRAAQPQPCHATFFSRSPLLSSIQSLLPFFTGAIMQIPPAFSALKKDGEPLYKLARQGQAPEIEARPVVVYRLEIVDFQPPLLTLDIQCGKGTYIRSLAHDLGQKLGVGAHLKTLARTAYGPFDIMHAVTMEQLEQAVKEGALSSVLQPMDAVLASWPPVSLTAEQEQDVHHGKQIGPGPLSSECHSREELALSLIESGNPAVTSCHTGELSSSSHDGLSPSCHDGLLSPSCHAGELSSSAHVAELSPPCHAGAPQSEASGERGGTPVPPVRFRAYSPGGSLVALLSLDAETGLWRPGKVFK